MGGFFISSYKGHTLGAFLLSLLFFLNPVLILLTVLGGSFSDFDHEFRRNRVLGWIVFSLCLSFIFYVFNLPFYIGLLGLVLGFIFLFSSHRGFTHSLLGGFILSFLIGAILFFSSLFVSDVFSFLGFDFKYSFLLVLFIFSFFILNKRVFALFFVFLIISYFFIPWVDFSFICIFLALFLGFLSHIILDSFSVSGVRVFYPFYGGNFYKSFGFILILILVLFSIFRFLFLFNLDFYF